MSNKETGGFTVRRFTVILGLTALMATSAQAQRGSWQGEIGIQGGFSRVKPSGTGAHDQIDLFDVPGFSLAPLVPSYGALFAIIPWKDKIAIEPTLSFSQLSSVSHNAVAWTARGDLALARGDDRGAGELFRRAAEALQENVF